MIHAFVSPLSPSVVTVKDTSLLSLFFFQSDSVLGRLHYCCHECDGLGLNGDFHLRVSATSVSGLGQGYINAIVALDRIPFFTWFTFINIFMNVDGLSAAIKIQRPRIR